MTIRQFVFLTICGFILSCNNGQNTSRTVLGEAFAREELQRSLSDPAAHNLVDKDSLLIKDKAMAIAMTEPLLFRVYGKKNIIRQRPYECYFIDNHWLVAGTLPKDAHGGTFLVIMDGSNGKLVRLTHGK